MIMITGMMRMTFGTTMKMSTGLMTSTGLMMTFGTMRLMMTSGMKMRKVTGTMTRWKEVSSMTKISI